MATSAWFDYNGYMANKLVQVQKADSAAGWDMVKLVKAFTDAGFVGDAGAEQHFFAHGQYEDVAPNAFFNATEYYRAKAAQVYGKDPKAVTDLEAASVQVAIKDSGMSAWSHYEQYGNTEKVNPSNSFDTEAYMNAKLTALNSVKDGKQYTLTEVYDAFKVSGLSALEHFMQYGGDPAKGEVAQKYDPKNPAIPSEFAVPESKKVSGGTGNGETYALTVDRDTVVGTVGDDLIIADLVKGTDATLNVVDSINGGGGTNTLRVFGKENAANLATADITNIQKLEVVAGKDLTLDAGVVAGLKSLTFDKAQFTTSTGDLTVTGIDGQKIAVTNTTIDATGNAILLTSDASALNLGLSGNKVADRVDAQIVVVGSKADTLNLDFSGTANTGNFEITNGTGEGNNSLTALKTITVAGDQHAKFTVSAKGVANFDASASKGGVEVSFFDANSMPPSGDIKIKGSAVDDQIWVQLGQIKSTSSFDFGAGENDVFGINYGDTTDINATNNTAAVKVINATTTAEMIGFNQQGGTTDLDVNLSVFTNIHKFLFKDGAGVTGITNDDILNVYEDNLLVLTKATAAEASSASGTGVVNVVAMDKAGNPAAVNIMNTVKWDKVVLSGEGNVVFSATLDNSVDALTSAATVDATNLSGSLKVLLGTAGGSVVKGGSAGDNIATNTGGLDILTGNGGADTFDVTLTKLNISSSGAEATDANVFSKLVDITDFKVAEKDALHLSASALTSLTKVTLGDGETAAAKAAAICNTAAGGGDNSNLEVSWFQDGTNTYVVLNTGDTDATTDDVVVKLAGLVDLTDGDIATTTGSIIFN